jgi:hypothetical protein
LIAHLDNSYGRKTSAELTTNADELKKPWDASTPIQSLFIRVDQCHRFDTTIPEDTIVRQVVDLICVHRGFESNSTTNNNDAARIQRVADEYAKQDKSRRAYDDAMAELFQLIMNDEVEEQDLGACDPEHKSH